MRTSGGRTSRRVRRDRMVGVVLAVALVVGGLVASARPVAAAETDAPAPAPAVAWHAVPQAGPNGWVQLLGLVAGPGDGTTALYTYADYLILEPGGPALPAKGTTLLVVHRDATGRVVWLHRAHGSSYDQHLAVGPGGEVVVVANFTTSATLDDDTTPLLSIGPGFTALLAFTASGDRAWQRGLAGGAYEFDLDVGPGGHVLLSGIALAGSELSVATGLAPPSGSAPNQQMVARIDRGGVLRWAVGVDGTSALRPVWVNGGDVAVSSVNTTYFVREPVVVHATDGPWTVAEPVPDERTVSVVFFLGGDGARGTRTAVRSTGTAGDLSITGMQPNPGGGLTLAGWVGTDTAMGWGGAPLEGPAGPRAVVLRVDPAGALVWSRSIRVTAGYLSEPRLAAGADGRLVVTAHMAAGTATSVVIGGGATGRTLPVSLTRSDFVAVLDGEGMPQWADVSAVATSFVDMGTAGPVFGGIVYGRGTNIGRDPARPVEPERYLEYAYGTRAAPSPCPVDLAVGVTAPVTEVRYGELALVTITVTNRSPGCAAEDAAVHITLPTDADGVPWYIDWTQELWDEGYDDGTGEWRLGRIEAGATRSLTLRLAAPAVAAAGPSNVVATARRWFRQTDPVPGDESARRAFTVADCSPDVEVELTLDPTTAEVGATTGLTLRGTNRGNCISYAPVLVEWPEGLTPLEDAWGGEGGWYGYDSPERRRELSVEIAPGKTVTATGRLAVDRPATGPLTVTARVQPDQRFGDPGPNTASAALTVLPPRPGVLSGTLTGAGGPAAGVHLLVARPAAPLATLAWAVTDADGRYRIEGLEPGSYVMRTVDYQGRFESGWAGGQQLPSTATTYRVVSGATVVVDLALAPNPKGAIVGAIKGRDGQPVSGVWVQLETYEGIVSIATSNADGIFMFGGLRDGYYRVLFWDLSGRYGSQYYGGGPDTFASRAIYISGGQVVLINAPLR